ncbi:MAG: signal peptidase I [Lachnospiraceae bacterium]|nr:signal peptidase I [Lachnospiraceae bacterium]
MAKSAEKKQPQAEHKEDEQSEEVNIVKEIVGMVAYIAVVILAVWFIITFVGQRTEVSGSSMYDTLEDQDNLWIDKLSYRFHDPERFDIVVFPFQNGSVYYIKRIIGLPGETVRIGEDGTIYIDGEPLDEDYGYETISPNAIGRAGEDVTLGADEYFVMGDNRNDSKDSRFDEVGNIKKNDLKGKAVFRIWPLSKFGTIE